MVNHLPFGMNRENFGLVGEWNENVPEAITAEAAMRGVEDFYPTKFFSLLTEPIFESITPTWKEIITTYIVDSVHEDSL